MDLGTIGGLPRIMDMGQCNDAYSAIKVAIALADAFECEVNELPLSMVELRKRKSERACVFLFSEAVCYDIIPNTEIVVISIFNFL